MLTEIDVTATLSAKLTTLSSQSRPRSTSMVMAPEVSDSRSPRSRWPSGGVSEKVKVR